MLFVPCDSPYFPQNLLEKLKSAVKNDHTLMAYAKDKEREHPTFCLMSVQLKEKLRAYLNEGERRLLQFMNKNGAVAVQFDEQEGRFVNFNTLEDFTINYLFNLEFCKKFSIIAVFTFYFIEELYYDANPFIFSH